METVYELIRAFPDISERQRQVLRELNSRQQKRNTYIYELFCKKLKQGIGRMQAYTETSEECFTAESNIRRIVKLYESRI